VNILGVIAVALFIIIPGAPPEASRGSLRRLACL